MTGILVTGSSRGIGAAAAVALSRWLSIQKVPCVTSQPWM